METMVGIFFLLFVLTLSMLFYFIPRLVALGRKHDNTTAIFFLNFFLGWTLIGWVGALVWACIKGRMEQND